MTYCNLVPKFLTDFQFWERKKTSILYVQALHEKPNKKILYATLAALAKLKQIHPPTLSAGF